MDIFKIIAEKNILEHSFRILVVETHSKDPLIVCDLVRSSIALIVFREKIKVCFLFAKRQDLDTATQREEIANKRELCWW